MTEKVLETFLILYTEMMKLSGDKYFPSNDP